MVELRGHHLICLNFFTGEGYDEEFVKRIEDALSSASITVIDTADYLCRACPYLDNGCTFVGEDEIRRMDERALELLDLKVGSEVTWTLVRERLRNAMRVWKEEFCRDCYWLNVCERSERWREL